MARRLALIFASTVLAALIGEGLLSLFAGKSLRDLFGDEPSLVFREQRDEERFAAAARNPGPYRVHPDPLVGYVMKSGVEFELAGAMVRADSVGMRVRPGPPAEPDALRLVVLGDSVAFGQGLAGNEVLAHQIEDLLRAVRGPDQPEVACFTVATPGWNARNAVHFLLDHWGDFDPDLVLWLPVENDLEDTDGVYETGHRRNLTDLATPDPWVPVNGNYAHVMTAGLRAKAGGAPVTEEWIGPPLLTADLSPASTWRLDDMVRQVQFLDERLQQHGAALALVLYQRHDLERVLRARLAGAGLTLPVIPLLLRMLASDTLPEDPHPNATTVRAFALWIVADLIARELVPASTGAALPDLPAGYERRRATLESPEELSQWVANHRDETRAALRTVIRQDTAEGIRQIYGGVNRDGSIAHGMRALLGPGGDRLTVTLHPLADKPELYPLPVAVLVDGIAMGTITVPRPDSVGVSEFKLPAAWADQPIEIALRPERWAVARVQGKSRVVACRLGALTRQ